MITKWDLYDPTRHGGMGGIYMALLTPFQYASYYAGETQNFPIRFGQHDVGFRTGLRTFVRERFISGAHDHTHIDFAQRWSEAKLIDTAWREFVYVPPSGKVLDQGIFAEGSSFLERHHTRLVCAMTLSEDDQKAIEARVQ